MNFLCAWLKVRSWGWGQASGCLWLVSGGCLCCLSSPTPPKHACSPCFGNPCCRVGVVVSRSFWNLPDLLIGMGLCISMSGKRGQRGFAKGKIKCVYSLPFSPLVYTDVSSPGPLPTRGLTGHRRMGSGSWLSRELDSLEVGLHRAVLGPAWGPS